MIRNTHTRTHTHTHAHTRTHAHTHTHTYTYLEERVHVQYLYFHRGFEQKRPLQHQSRHNQTKIIIGAVDKIKKESKNSTVKIHDHKCDNLEVRLLFAAGKFLQLLAPNLPTPMHHEKTNNANDAEY